MQSNLYLIGNIFEDDRIQRKIKTSPELIFAELERLRIENNILSRKENESGIDSIKQMVSQLLISQNTVEHKVENIHRIFENTGDLKPVENAVEVQLTQAEQIAAEIQRRKALETTNVLKEIYRKQV